MIVIACEGKSEVILVNHLIGRGIFFAKIEEMIDERPMQIRQLTEIASIINSLDYEEEIDVYRIGDTQRDEYNLKPFEARKIRIHKVCTKPEIEILVIIALGEYDNYCKEKNNQNLSPKEYLKIHCKDCKSVERFIDNNDIVPAIKEYKRIKKHDKEEMYLYDLLIEKGRK